MNYIIFDLELNSKPFKNRHPNEIVEIGAVKLDDGLNLVSSFQAFVKPKIYKKLFSVVKRKTKIDQDDINSAESFKAVLPKFKQWIDKDYILCSWGHDDIHHLKSNCEFHRLGVKWIKRNLDIQKQFSKVHNLTMAQMVSLKNALIMMGIEVDENLHRAEVDARVTSEIFKRIFDKIDFTEQIEEKKVATTKEAT